MSDSSINEVPEEQNLEPSGLYHLNYTPTISFPISSVGEDARAMHSIVKLSRHPRGSGKTDPKGDGMRLPDVVVRFTPRRDALLAGNLMPSS
jgi:hypothetical protein